MAEESLPDDFYEGPFCAACETMSAMAQPIFHSCAIWVKAINEVARLTDDPVERERLAQANNLGSFPEDFNGAYDIEGEHVWQRTVFNRHKK